MKCKRCGNDDFYISEEVYFKMNRILKFLLALLIVIIALPIMFRVNLALGILIIVIGGGGLNLYEHLRSRKSRTKFICKKCGEVHYK